MTLIELAERVEKLERPCRVTDVLIGSAVRWLPIDGGDWLRDWRGEFGPMPRMDGRIAAFHDNGEPAVHWEAPDFTGSLDSAASLMPDGCWGDQGTRADGKGYAELCGPSCASVTAATPALALCAAALRAQWDTYAKRRDPQGLGPKDSGPVGRQADAPKGGIHDPHP